MLLSIVIVAKNEEQNISRCVKSVLESISCRPRSEVILIDSYSTDRTIEIAKSYEINIIQLKKEWVLSPAAGRFVGVNNTCGKYILIIDGDMELLIGWLEKALDYMENNPEVGMVVGRQYDVHFSGKFGERKVILRKDYTDRKHIEKINSYSGSSLFRRKAIIEGGNFQPFLRAGEESEISYRIRNSGYGLYFLPVDSIYHYPEHEKSLKETKRRFKVGLYAGMGDACSWCLRNKYFSVVREKYALFLFFILLLTVCTGSVIYSLVINNYYMILYVICLLMIFISLMAMKQRSLTWGLWTTFNISIISFSILKGLFKKIPDSKHYPTDILWIKRI